MRAWSNQDGRAARQRVCGCVESAPGNSSLCSVTKTPSCGGKAIHMEGMLARP